MIKLLLLSNSTMTGTSFFTWPKPHVRHFLGSEVKALVFIPFAAVALSYDAYFQVVSEAFGSLGYHVTSVHSVGDKKGLVERADGIVVGGGNTFALVTKMYDADLLSVVRKQVIAGTPYIGWSAGANLACPTLKTSNDMPIVMPPSFATLALIPFQINPHYHELKFKDQGGETRRERLEEFLKLNPEKKVIGLPEGMLINREGEKLTLIGEGTARLFESGNATRDVRGGTDISFLL